MYHLSSAWHKNKGERKFTENCERLAINGEVAIFDLKEEYCDITEDTILEEDEQEVFAFVHPCNYHLINIGDTPVFFKDGSKYITVPIEEYIEHSQKAKRYNWIKRLFKAKEKISEDLFDL